MIKSGEYKIIDNFFSEEEFNFVNNMFWSNQFPWFYAKNINKNDSENYYFQHILRTETSNPGEIIESVHFWNFWSRFQSNINKIVGHNKNFHLIRVKSNFYHRQSENVLHGYHRDINQVKNNVALFFLNTNNAKTYIKDVAEVDAVANRVLLFNGNDLHASSSPTDVKGRITVNINYQEFEDGEL